ncbi:MAG: hypothetical protein IJ197_02150 [Bacteroidaceae bacterium]|nr:hypothetical protein [Bacteroidaceae bacterium]
MKRAFLMLIVVAIVATILNHRRDHAHDSDTYLEQLQYRIECATWQTHYDPAYGYAVRYLSCFVPASTEGEPEGTCRFAYVEDVTPLQNVTYIVQEVTTQTCVDTLHPYAEIRRMANEMGAISLRQSDDCYLMSGKLKSRDPRVTAYCFNARYVLRQRLWFVDTIYYPEDFAPVMQRLVDEVNDWQPFAPER